VGVVVLALQKMRIIRREDGNSDLLCQLENAPVERILVFR
jgi:hypothetical protein